MGVRQLSESCCDADLESPDAIVPFWRCLPSRYQGQPRGSIDAAPKLRPGLAYALPSRRAETDKVSIKLPRCHWKAGPGS